MILLQNCVVIYSNMSWLKNDNSGKNGNIKKYLLEDTNKLHNVLLLEKKRRTEFDRHELLYCYR